LAALAVLVLVTGGGRWRVAGVVISLTSFRRLAVAAAVVAIARRVAWRPRRVPARRLPALALAGIRRVAARPRPLAVLAACILFYLVNNTIWLLTDASVPSFDKAAHARFGLEFLRLFQSPAELTSAKLLAVTQYWPPFFHLCSVPFTWVLGFSVQGMASANVLFLFVAVLAVYRVGARLFDDEVGLGAVVLTLLYPMVYALSREVLVDFALIAMVMLSLYAVLAGDAGLDRRWSAAFGAILGCAMLTKWTAVAFVAGPAILWLIVCLRREGRSAGAVIYSLAIVVVAACAVALPWYVNSFNALLHKATTEAFGSDPAQEGDPIKLLPSIRWYWNAVLDALILKPLLLPTLVGLGAFAARVARRRTWTGWSFLLCSIVPAMAFFVLIPNKDARFAAPLLPLFAIMVAAGLRSLPWKAVRVALWAFVLVIGVLQFYAISFGWPVQVAHFYTHPPDRHDWKVHDIVAALETIQTSRPLRVAVLPDDPHFEPNLFQLDAAIRSSALQIDGFGARGEPVSALLAYDVLVSKTGTIAVEYTAASRLRFRQDLAEWIRSGHRAPDVTLWRTWPLPDGSRAEAYLIHAGPGQASPRLTPSGE
jgi:4-amino-4-deoxy-L-arabinose transferase-like glycosyltransferase